jgi:hypothetical protein
MRMRRLNPSYLLPMFAALALTPAAMQAQYTISGTSPTSLPSNTGENINLTVSGSLLPTTANYGYCFYAGGYGASATPIPVVAANPDVVSIPASTIDAIPTSQYAGGVFTAQLSIVFLGTLPPTCNGSTSDYSNTFNIPINLVPFVSDYSPFSIPQTNPQTGGQPNPATANLQGGGFLSTTTVNFSWTGGNANAPQVFYVSSTSLVVKFPPIPAGVTSVTATPCNGTNCGPGATISLTALTNTTGTISGTPNPLNVGGAVAVTTVFAPTANPSVPVLGAPSGLITLTINGGTPSNVGQLTLDPATGTFSAASTITLPRQTSNPLQTADFNGDGIPDILYSDSSSNLHINLSGGRTGNYQGDITIPLPGSCSGGTYLSSTTGDLNNDGFADIVELCLDEDNTTYIYSLLSNGDGTFRAPIELAGTFGSAIALGDINQDNKQDLVVYGPFSLTCAAVCYPGYWVFTGNGDGSFTSAFQTPVNVGTVKQFQLVDIDLDGYPDIVSLDTVEGVSSSIDIFLNHGGTSVGVPPNGAPYSTPSTTVALRSPGSPSEVDYLNLVIGDLREFGYQDVGAAFFSDGSTATSGVDFVPNTTTAPGNATFGTLYTVNTTNNNFLSSAALGDFNGDGYPDLVMNVECVTACQAGGNSVDIQINDHTGHFSAATYPNLTLIPGTVSQAVPVRVNQDPYADLLVLNYTTDDNQPMTSYITSGSGRLTDNVQLLTTGEFAFVAQWQGNYDFLGGTVNFTVTVNGDVSNTSIGSSLATSQYGQPVTFTSAVSSKFPGTPTGTVTFSDGATPLGTVPLTAAVASLPIATLTVGTHVITATYSGDGTFSPSTSIMLQYAVTQANPAISWGPAPATITYGTALVAGQLDATAATPYVATVPGTFQYTPVLGTVLGAGTQTLNVTFTPTDAVDFSKATGTAKIIVSRATPVVTWNPPASIVTGTPLSATQLNATAAFGSLGTVAGTFAYTPLAGTVLPSGNGQALSLLFTPTDTTDFSTAGGGTTINVLAVAISQLTPASVTIGASATTVTLTGTGFLPNSVVSINGAATATTYISPTSLSVVIPAANLLTVQTLKLTVNDPTQSQTSAAASFAVVSPAAQATFTGPTTVQPAQQPTLNFALTTAYPVPITGTVTLTFAGNGGVDDPSIQFSTGGRTQTFTIPANSTTTPTIQLQSGTDAGAITVTLTLIAGGQVITPASVVPVVINLPAAPPVVTSMTLTRSGDTLTANIMGYSNTRDLAQATFTFTGANGDAITDPQVVIPATALFTAWFGNATSQQYGSTFLYTQEFNLNNAATSIGSVAVTLTNSTGTSTSATAQ